MSKLIKKFKGTGNTSNRSRQSLDKEEPVGLKHKDRPLGKQETEQSNPISNTVQDIAVHPILTPIPDEDNEERYSSQGATLFTLEQDKWPPDQDQEQEIHHSETPNIHISGSGNTNHDGTPGIHISGSGDINHSGTPDKHISGSGDINHSGTPDIHISGFGDINHSGTPDTHIPDTGDIQHSGTQDIHISGSSDTHHYGSQWDKGGEVEEQWRQNQILGDGQQNTSIAQDSNALNSAQEELISDDKHDKQQKSPKSKEIIADILVRVATQGSQKDLEDGTELKQDAGIDEECSSTEVQGPELAKESSTPEESCLRQRSGRRPESESKQLPVKRDPNLARPSGRDPSLVQPGQRDPSPPRPQVQEQEWEKVLKAEVSKAVEGYRPRNNPIMSVTLQAASTVLIASLVSFFVSHTGWQRPNTVQVPAPSFNLVGDKEAFVQEVLSKLQNNINKDQQESKNYLTSEQYYSDKEKLIHLFEEIQKKEADLNNIHQQYSSDKENQKHFYEEQLKKQAELKIFYEKSITDLKVQYEDLLKHEVENLTRFYNEKLQTTNSSLHKEFEDKLLAVQEQCQANLSTINSTVLRSLDDARSELAEKHRQLGDEVEAMPKTLEDRGFTNIETFGPILLAVAVVEVVLVMCVCGLLCPAAGKRGVTGSGQLQANSHVVKTNQQELPLINTNNNNLAVICFHDSDEARCRKWTEAIIEMLATKPQLVVHRVNSVSDVDHIPACRVALVFLVPDEREMIIEDERYHIGQGLRRLAIQRLMDSGVTVFGMIYNDKRPVNVQRKELFNSQLKQVEEHVQLQHLQREKHLISFGLDLGDFQMRHAARDLAKCFSTTTLH